jgi:HPt (histidine-containing phosphotransfer) domain-containing protein
LALFAESTEKARMELRQAERAGDAALVGAVAHRFKSTALYLGAAALAAACARLERAGAAKDLASIRTESPTFDSEVDRVLAAVTALRTRSETSPEHAR